MQIAFIKLPLEWKNLEELVGSEFLAGKTYQIQSRGVGNVIFLESDEQPDEYSYSGVVLYPSGTLNYEKSIHPLWCRAVEASAINISTIGE